MLAIISGIVMLAAAVSAAVYFVMRYLEKKERCDYIECDCYGDYDGYEYDDDEPADEPPAVALPDDPEQSAKPPAEPPEDGEPDTAEQPEQESAGGDAPPEPPAEAKKSAAKPIWMLIAGK